MSTDKVARPRLTKNILSAGVQKKKPYVRKHFDLWSRRESDSLKSRLLGQLGYPEGTTANYEFFQQLPEVTWSEDCNLASNLQLVQARALFSKDEDLPSPIDKEAEAIKSFYVSEETCKAVNEHIRNGTLLSEEKGSDVIMYYAREKIASIIGECPTIAELDLTFGPGSSTSCRRKTSARWKLSTIPSISASCVNLLSELTTHLHRWFALHNNVLLASAADVETVTKNYKTYRCICIEPSVNSMVQRGIGQILKRKLFAAGINLFDQNINKERARRGSLDGLSCTTDLVRASDSKASLLVMDLFPIAWFELLSSARTPVVRLVNLKSRTEKRPSYDYIELEKFSSMGNGFTFELESLVFYSLAWGIARYKNLPFDLTVYGDDIVANPLLTQEIHKYFPRLGFSVNVEKSYSSGPFRESCGGDYFLGLDVRPFFIKNRFSYHQVVCFYNFLMRKPWFDPEKNLRKILLEAVPEQDRLFGPDGYGDGHFVSESPLRTYATPHGRKRGFSGYTFTSIVAVPNRDEQPLVGDSLIPAYTLETRPTTMLDLGCMIYNRGCAQWSALSARNLAISVEIARSEFSSQPSDVYVLRSQKGGKVSCRKVKIYVLG